MSQDRAGQARRPMAHHLSAPHGRDHHPYHHQHPQHPQRHPQQPQLEPELGADAVVSEFKRSGGFDAMRRSLLEAFQASPAGVTLAAQLRGILDTDGRREVADRIVPQQSQQNPASAISMLAGVAGTALSAANVGISTSSIASSSPAAAAATTATAGIDSVTSISLQTSLLAMLTRNAPLLDNIEQSVRSMLRTDEYRARLRVELRKVIEKVRDDSLRKRSGSDALLGDATATNTGQPTQTSLKRATQMQHVEVGDKPITSQLDRDSDQESGEMSDTSDVRTVRPSIRTDIRRHAPTVQNEVKKRDLETEKVKENPEESKKSHSDSAQLAFVAETASKRPKMDTVKDGEYENGSKDQEHGDEQQQQHRVHPSGVSSDIALPDSQTQPDMDRSLADDVSKPVDAREEDTCKVSPVDDSSDGGGRDATNSGDTSITPVDGSRDGNGSSSTSTADDSSTRNDTALVDTMDVDDDDDKADNNRDSDQKSDDIAVAEKPNGARVGGGRIKKRGPGRPRKSDIAGGVSAKASAASTPVSEPSSTRGRRSSTPAQLKSQRQQRGNHKQQKQDEQPRGKPQRGKRKSLPSVSSRSNDKVGDDHQDDSDVVKETPKRDVNRRDNDKKSEPVSKLVRPTPLSTTQRGRRRVERSPTPEGIDTAARSDPDSNSSAVSGPMTRSRRSSSVAEVKSQSPSVGNCDGDGDGDGDGDSKDDVEETHTRRSLRTLRSRPSSASGSGSGGSTGGASTPTGDAIIPIGRAVAAFVPVSDDDDEDDDNHDSDDDDRRSSNRRRGIRSNASTTHTPRTPKLSCYQVIVRGYDASTSTYTVSDLEEDDDGNHMTWEVPSTKMVDYETLAKTRSRVIGSTATKTDTVSSTRRGHYRLGDKVYSLYVDATETGGGDGSDEDESPTCTTVFYPAEIVRVLKDGFAVRFEDGDTSVVQCHQMFRMNDVSHE